MSEGKRIRTSPRAKFAEDIRWHMREEFTRKLKIAFVDKFRVAIETNYNIISCNLVTTRKDEKMLTTEMFSFIAGFEAAWLAAGELVEKIK